MLFATMMTPGPIEIAALYKFTALPDHAALRVPLFERCQKAGVKGILLLAKEGINGTISGTPEGLHDVLSFIRTIPGLSDLEIKTSYSDENPFLRMRVREKREIVTMGVEGIDPNKSVGRYVEPNEWNDLISDPDVVVVDTRNDYEVQIGTFERAINPNIKTFREFPQWMRTQLEADAQNARPTKVAMFCTGGIRCEKATAFMRGQGFEEVYHLKGGILKYLEQVPENESLWNGQCFVFDRRVSVGHRLETGPYKLCPACRQPTPGSDGTGGGFANEICENCANHATKDQKRRAKARQHQIDLAKKQGTTHLGPQQPNRPDNSK